MTKQKFTTNLNTRGNFNKTDFIVIFYVCVCVAIYFVCLFKNCFQTFKESILFFERRRKIVEKIIK